MFTKLRIHLQTDISTPTSEYKVPSTPNSASKRFSRKRQISNESKASIKSLKGSKKDLSLHLQTESNPEQSQSYTSGASRQQMLNMIKKTSYIKTSRNSSIKQEDKQKSFKKDCGMKESYFNSQNFSTPLMTPKHQKTETNISMLKLNNSSLKSKPLKVNLKLNENEQQKVIQNEGQCKSSYKGQQNINKRMLFLQEQVEIKKNQLMLLEDRYSRTKKEDIQKQKTIFKLNQQINRLNKQNYLLNHLIEQSQNRINQLIKSYQIQPSYYPNTPHSLLPQITGLEKEIKQYISQITTTHDDLLWDLQKQLKTSREMIIKLEIGNLTSKKKQVDMEKIQVQLRQKQEEIKKMEKKNKFLNLEFQDARALIIRLKKDITELKSQIAMLKAQNYKNHDDSGFIVTAQTSMIIQPISQERECTNLNNISQLLSQLEDQSNMSLNFSNVSELNLFEDT